MVMYHVKHALVPVISFMTLVISLVLIVEIRNVPSSQEVREKVILDEDPLNQYLSDFSKRKYLNSLYIFDERGVPLIEKRRKYYYHPVQISQFALGAYMHFQQTGDIKARSDFISCARWLKDNLKKHGRYYYWEYNFNNKEYPGGIHKRPWYSAMAQGQGALVLLKAFRETYEEEYLRLARLSLEPIFHDISEGGISIVRNNNYIFPQEYPTNPPSDILNGAISAFVGIYEYAEMTQDPDIIEYREIIIRTFARTINDYDAGYWSYYSRWPKYLASPHYHMVHISQLEFLYAVSEDERFLRIADRFKEYQNSWIDRAIYIVANHFRQVKEFRLSDIRKIPKELRRILIKLVKSN